MSTTYTLACDKHKQRHWAGQSGRFYDSAVSFMAEHYNCGVHFQVDGTGCDRELEILNYKEVEYKEPYGKTRPSSY